MNVQVKTFSIYLQHCNAGQFFTKPTTSKNTLSSKTSIFKLKNHNNNNKKGKSPKSTNMRNFCAKDNNEQQTQSAKFQTTTNHQQKSDLSYIVPVEDPLTAPISVQNNSNSFRSWSQSKSPYATTATSSLDTKHKFPNMDPNG